MSAAKRIESLLHSVLPELCGLCGQWLREPMRPALCGHCLASLPWNNHACLQCAAPLAAPHAEDCGSLPYDLAICPLRYSEPVTGWVLDSKRRGGLPATRLLADCLTSTVADVYDQAELPTVLVPVPLSWQRRVYRGHNQALILATMIGRRLGIPVNGRALRRDRHTRIQPGLSPVERQHNLSGAFSSRRRWPGEHIAIIDDILTSGATAQATASCLLAADCRRVDVWCAARAISS